MIRVRYRDSNEFAPGLHVAAERHGRTTTIYLLSGLTTPERRSALRRLRLSARMGHCPQLPAAQLAIALLADWIRTAIGRAGAVFRLHPAGSTVPVMVLSGGAIAFLLLSTVSIRVLPAPRTATQSSSSGTSPVVPAGALPISGVSRGPAAGLGGLGAPGQRSDSRQLTQPGSRDLDGSLARPPSLAAAGGGTGTRSGTGSGAGTSGGAGTSSGTGSGSGAGTGTGSSGGTTPGGGTDPTPSTGPEVAASTPPPVTATPPQGAAAPSSSAPEPAPGSPTPGSPTPGSGGLCMNVGPLGVCLNI